MTQIKIHRGSCHCGAVRFEAELDLSKGRTQCNCSICTKINASSQIIQPSAFRLIDGESSLSKYPKGTNVMARHFCSECGVHVFGKGFLEQLGGAFVSVNLQTLDDVELAEVTTTYWDGRHDNWMSGTRTMPWPITRAVDPQPAP